jgi:hypothetical protein
MVLVEFLRPLGDGLRFARGFNVAEPHGLFANDQNGPTNKYFSCHEERAYSIGAAASGRAKSVQNVREVD